MVGQAKERKIRACVCVCFVLVCDGRGRGAHLVTYRDGRDGRGRESR